MRRCMALFSEERSDSEKSAQDVGSWQVSVLAVLETNRKFGTDLTESYRTSRLLKKSDRDALRATINSKQKFYQIILALTERCENQSCVGEGRNYIFSILLEQSRPLSRAPTNRSAPKSAFKVFLHTTPDNFA
jgi:hypothetical protein